MPPRTTAAASPPRRSRASSTRSRANASPAAGLERPRHGAAGGLPRSDAASYDKLVSIEMIEAIGAAYLDDVFRQLGRLLKPGGLALIQAITIEDHRYAQALRSVDFIKRHVFPGSFIPSIQAHAGGQDARQRPGAGRHSRISAIPTRARSRPGGERFLRAAARRCARWDSMSASSACGSSTWPTARAASANARSVWRTCCWPSPAAGRQPPASSFVGADSGQSRLPAGLVCRRHRRRARTGSGPALLATAVFAAWQLAVSERERPTCDSSAPRCCSEVCWTASLSTSGRAALRGRQPPRCPLAGLPLWILALWVAFALTVQSLLGLSSRGRPLLAARWARPAAACLPRRRARLDAVSFAVPAWHGLLGLAAGWAIALRTPGEPRRAWRANALGRKAGVVVSPGVSVLVLWLLAA